MGWGIALGVILGGALGLSVGAFLSGAELATIAGLAIAPLTAGLVGLTWYLAEETRKARQQQLAPNVIVTLEPYTHAIVLFELVIQNVGSGAAYDLDIRLDPDVIYKDDEGGIHKISELSLLKISILKPGQKINRFISRYENIENRHTNIYCTCRDAEGREHVSNNTINLDALSSYGATGKDNLLRIAEASEKIEQAISRIVLGNKRIGIDQFTSEDRKQEHERREQQYKKLREISQAEKPASAEGGSPPETAPTKPSPNPEN